MLGPLSQFPASSPCSQLLAFLVHCWPPSLAPSLASLFSDPLNRRLGSARCYLLRSCVVGAQLASMRAWERPEMPPAPVFKIWEAIVQTFSCLGKSRALGRFALRQEKEKQKASETLTLTKAAVWISPGKEWSLEHLCCEKMCRFRPVPLRPSPKPQCGSPSNSFSGRPLSFLVLFAYLYAFLFLSEEYIL